jgi:hypothetical protein
VTVLLDGIGKRYRIGGPWVLRDVRLELRPGRVVRIQGQVNAAIRAITPSDQGAQPPLLPTLLVLAATAACWALSTHVAARKEFHTGGEAD